MTECEMSMDDSDQGHQSEPVGPRTIDITVDIHKLHKDLILQKRLKAALSPILGLDPVSYEPFVFEVALVMVLKRCSVGALSVSMCTWKKLCKSVVCFLKDYRKGNYAIRFYFSSQNIPTTQLLEQIVDDDFEYSIISPKVMTFYHKTFAAKIGLKFESPQFIKDFTRPIDFVIHRSAAFRFLMMENWLFPKDKEESQPIHVGIRYKPESNDSNQSQNTASVSFQASSNAENDKVSVDNITPSEQRLLRGNTFAVPKSQDQEYFSDDDRKRELDRRVCNSMHQLRKNARSSPALEKVLLTNNRFRRLNNMISKDSLDKLNENAPVDPCKTENVPRIATAKVTKRASPARHIKVNISRPRQTRFSKH